MMTIEIQRPELEALITQRLQSGLFQNVEDVLIQSLRTTVFWGWPPPPPNNPCQALLLQIQNEQRPINASVKAFQLKQLKGCLEGRHITQVEYQEAVTELNADDSSPNPLP